MKILAVDYGASRTGLAVCDPTEFLTTPITPQITLKARPKVAAEVCRIAQEQKAELIVVGLPLNMDGTEGERAEKSRKLGKTLQIWSGLTVTRVEQDFVVEAGQGTDGKGTTIWNGSRYPAEATDKLHHYSGALCMAADSSGQCASVFYIMSTLPGGDSITQELTDQMNSAGYRAEVVSAYQTAGGAPYLDYTDTVLGQVYEGMDVVDTIAQAAVDENQKPTETITINSVSIETYQAQ